MGRCMPMNATRGLGAVAGVVLASLGGGCLDLLGHGEDVIEHRSNEGMFQLEDDRIEDKHPPFDAARTVTESFKQSYAACTITMNKTAAVPSSTSCRWRAARPSWTSGCFTGGPTRWRPSPASRTRTRSRPWRSSTARSSRSTTGSTPPWSWRPRPASGRCLRAGLRAHHACGGGRCGRTRRRSTTPRSWLGTAQILAGETPTVDPSVQTRARNRATAFEADKKFSRPIGFYTWTPALERVFTRDRFLQNRDGGTPTGRSRRSRSCSARTRRCSPTTSASPACTRG